MCRFVVRIREVLRILPAHCVYEAGGLVPLGRTVRSNAFIFNQIGGGSKTMKHLTKFFTLGCVSVLIALVGLPGAFAQSTHYVDPASTSTTAADCLDQDVGCTFATAVVASTTANDVIAFRVRRAGGTVRIPLDGITDAAGRSFDSVVRFSTYQRSGGTGVRGTVEFTGDDAPIMINSGGQILRNANVTVRFKAVHIAPGVPDPFGVDVKNQGGWEVSDYMQIGGDTEFNKLVVAKDLTLRGVPAAEDASGSVLTVSKLTVNSGATLTIGTKGQSEDATPTTPDNPLQLRVPLMKGDKDSVKDFEVKGTINGTGAVWIAYVTAERGENLSLHEPSDYAPDDKNKIDHNDCVQIQGGGRILNDIHAVAAGNVCISLREIGGLIAVGSIAETGSGLGVAFDSITTDIIFRNTVKVDGDVQQWNDARVIFEGNATIDGTVTLAEGAFPEVIGSNYGAARVTDDNLVFVRDRIQIDAGGSCEYVRDEEVKDRVSKFPGIQFEEAAVIEDDLVLNFENTENKATAAAAPEGPKETCRTSLIFMGPPAGQGAKPANWTRTSSVGGNLDFRTAAEIILHGDDSTRTISGKPTKFSSWHNLNLGGDLYSETGGVGKITMDLPAIASKITGECKGNDDISLDAVGNRVTFTDDNDHVVVIGEDEGIFIPTLVADGELSVEGGGTLQVTTLLVDDDGEVVSEENIQVGDSDPDDREDGTLILKGRGLDGSLHAGSRIMRLSYGGRSTDTAPLIDGGTLVLHSGAGEVLFRDALTAKTVGLCSGTLALADPGDDDDHTLVVTDMLHVGDGDIRLDANDPGSIGTDVSKTGSSADGYILRYITGGERKAGSEWFNPRDIVIDHKDAVITYEGSASIPGKLHIVKGKLHVTKDLTVGASSHANDRFLMVDIHSVSGKDEKAVLHAASVTTHGPVTVDGILMTDDGDLNLSGGRRRHNKADVAGSYVSGTAKVTIGAKGIVNLGKGDMILGPEVTAKQDGLLGDWALNANDGNVKDDAVRPVAGVSIGESGEDKGALMMTGAIRVLKGSKQTMLEGEKFGTVVFDGTRTPNDKETDANKQNWDGTLYFYSPKVVVDSLSATQGAVEFGAIQSNNSTEKEGDATAAITKNVELSSGKIYADHLDSLSFGGDLEVSGTGGFTSRQSAKVMIDGNFMLETDEMKKGVDMHNPVGGTYLSGSTEKTVMGDYMVSGKGVAERFGSEGDTKLILKGNFHFDLVAEDKDADEDYMLKANIEFSGKSQQSIETSAIDLSSVTIANNEGVMLMSDVMQSKDANLTLTKGVIAIGDHAWIFKNTETEENLVRRMSARGGDKCGPDNDQECSAAIWKGSRQSYVSGMLTRHLMDGNAGGGEVTGGYLYPVGGSEGDNSFFRPVILQLPVDLGEAEAVTVSTIPADSVMATWPSENLLVQADGGMLTLDVYSDIFWKLDLGDETISSNLNIRVAAEGISNVFNSARLRIVQWDCDGSDARMAGTFDLGGAEDDPTFAVNDFVNGVLNITQEGVNIGSCSILGIASNGLENPIHLDPLTGGLTKVQFIHNLPLPVPVDLFLDGIKLMGGIGFQSATGYGYYAAGDHMISIAPVVPPGVPADTIDIPLTSLANEQNYAVIAHGAVTDPKIKIVQTRLESAVENMVEAILVHGSGDLGDVDVRVLDPADNVTPTRLLANNFSLDAVTRYIALAPGAHNVQVTSPDNREEVGVYYLDLNGYQGETVILNLSGGKDDLGLMGVGKYGNVFLSQVVTGIEEEGTSEIPTEFALHGNYPNPFNPSTRIEFDLPESAQVSLQVIDMLGRQVMTLPAKEVEAGANRTLELNATSLASGHYLYRMIAIGAESRYVKTGRMTLVK